MTANTAWPRKRLKYFVDRKTQKAPVERGSHYVGLENVEPWTGRYLPTEAEIETESSQFRCGDVLFGKLRPYWPKCMSPKPTGHAHLKCLCYAHAKEFLSNFSSIGWSLRTLLIW
jgi:type I restriction enzyme S subunit